MQHATNIGHIFTDVINNEPFFANEELCEALLSLLSSNFSSELMVNTEYLNKPFKLTRIYQQVLEYFVEKTSAVRSIDENSSKVFVVKDFLLNCFQELKSGIYYH